MCGGANEELAGRLLDVAYVVMLVVLAMCVVEEVDRSPGSFNESLQANDLLTRWASLCEHDDSQLWSKPLEPLSLLHDCIMSSGWDGSVTARCMRPTSPTPQRPQPYARQR